MAQLNVSLPEGLKSTVDRVIEGGFYSSPSDYIRDLIRRDEARRHNLAELQALIDEGFASGVSPRTPNDIIEDIIARRTHG